MHEHEELAPGSPDGPPAQAPSPQVGIGVRAALLTLALIGLGLALTLVRVKLRLELDPSYESSCNFGSAFNCDVVQTSSWSTVFGQPLALWGAATYLTLALLVLRLGSATGRALLAAIALGSVAVVGHSAWLAWISHSRIGSFCLYCMGMYAVNLGVLGVSWASLRGPGLAASLRTALRPAALMPAGAALAAVTLAVVLVHGQVKDAWTAERIAQIAAEATAAPAVVATAGPAPSADPAAAAPAAAAASASVVAAGPADAGIHTHPEGFRYRDEISSKGRGYFEVPVLDTDFVLGPADAKVTVVEFADFECGYCRSLMANILPLKETFKGKVRWVFKHFPLDNRCNPVMKGTMHAQACDAAKAANCAGLQGKFWEMHDKLYGAGMHLNAENLRTWAGQVGVDLTAWDACFASDDIGHAKTRKDVTAGRFAKIAGTPRTYINGHLVPGIVSTEVFAYYLKSALAQAEAAPTAAAPAVAAARTEHGMVEVAGPNGPFWIDAFEASLGPDGKAVSRASVLPAEVSWIEADQACRAAGKRLCSELEWISACAGAPAVDNNGNGDPTDDDVEGQLYPYGSFHAAGRCHDDTDGDGEAVATGSKPGCVTPSGIFDLSGNVAEWTGATGEAAMLSGGDFRFGAKATCAVRQDRFGRGYRNRTTGFRCCADAPVAPSTGDAVVDHRDHGAEGRPMPTLSLDKRGGGKVSDADLRGKVTIVSFFASWCGPCRKEMPELEAFYQAHRAKGLQVLSIGVDVRPEDAERFVDEVKPSFWIALDPDAVSMGAFGVKGMPTTFLIGKDGKIAERLVGINADKVKAFQDHALRLLGAP